MSLIEDLLSQVLLLGKHEVMDFPMDDHRMHVASAFCSVSVWRSSRKPPESSTLCGRRRASISRRLFRLNLR